MRLYTQAPTHKQISLKTNVEANEMQASRALSFTTLWNARQKQNIADSG